MAKDICNRKLCGRGVAERRPHPAVDHRQEQGHQEVPRRHVRLREDHRRQGRCLDCRHDRLDDRRLDPLWFQVSSSGRRFKE